MQQEHKENEIAAQKVMSPSKDVTSPLKNEILSESPVKPAKNRMSFVEDWSYDDAGGWLFLYSW